MDEKPKVGEILRGQGWAELHGIFTLSELLNIVATLQEKCAGLEKQNDSKN